MTRCIVAGTGPSLADAIPILRGTRMPIIGVNRVYQDLPLVALVATNYDFWATYWNDPALRQSDILKITTDHEAAGKYSLTHFDEIDAPGLSTTPGLLHHHHGSGGLAIGVALQMGYTEIVLVGYDLRYPGGYDGAQRNPGSGRHYFGEYPEHMQHWTQQNIGPGGEIGGLIKTYSTIDPAKYGIRIINCTPDSALTCFETGNLREYILC